MSYLFESRIRFSEVGEDEKLTLNGIINYFQDASIFHSEDVGLGADILREMGRGWVLSSWQIIVERYPAMGERVEIATWAYGFKGFFGHRNFTLKSTDGEMLAYANSLWTFMDFVKGRPTMLAKEYAEAYGFGEKLDMEYASRKVPIPAESVVGEAFSVRAHHLDSNHHVNNGQYVQVARELLPQDFQVYQMRAEYKKSAVLGDMIIPMIHQEQNVYTVALCDENRNPYAVVEFTRKG